MHRFRATAPIVRFRGKTAVPCHGELATGLAADPPLDETCGAASPPASWRACARHNVEELPVLCFLLVPTGRRPTRGWMKNSSQLPNQEHNRSFFLLGPQGRSNLPRAGARAVRVSVRRGLLRPLRA